MARHIIAVGLLTEEDLDLLGATFTRLWPVADAPQFNELLAAIDEADCRLEAERMPLDGEQSMKGITS